MARFCIMKTSVFVLVWAFLLTLFVSCTNAPKETNKGLDFAGGSSEETNAITVAIAPLVFQGPHSFRVTPDSLDPTAGAKHFAAAAKVMPSGAEEGAHNLFGKLANGPDSTQSVFSFALVKNACGTSGVRYAFFLTDGRSLSCENAVISSLEAPLNAWARLRVVWGQDTLSLYQDGQLAARSGTSLGVLPASSAPFYLGLSGASFAIDSLSFSTEATHELP